MATSTSAEFRRSNAFRKRKAVAGNCFGLVLWLALGSVACCQSADFLQAKALAEKGDAAAADYVGWCYAKGKGVPKNQAEAVRWYRQAAEQGEAKAQSRLGTMYEEGNGGVPKDMKEAAKWYRKAAEQGIAEAQYLLSDCYFKGNGVEKDGGESIKWLRKSAENGLDGAQKEIGVCYYSGDGVPKDFVEAARWFTKAAEQGFADAQFLLGTCYGKGEGVPKDSAESAKWNRKAAEQGFADAETHLAACMIKGEGVPRDYVEAYKWANLAAAQGDSDGAKLRQIAEKLMTPDQVAEAQRLSRAFKPRMGGETSADRTPVGVAEADPFASGTGFFITADGFLMTNAHVVKEGTKFQLVTRAGITTAKVVKVDAANDLALLKAEGSFAPLPVTASRAVRLGSTVATVGFPNIGLQGFAPKLAKGEIAALSGVQDDARYFQISVPVQPGNSGGALVDERGNVVGIVSAKLSAKAAFDTSGALPENVNYAVKSSFLLGFLESMPAVAAKLKEPNTKDQRFEDAVKSVEQSTVLVLVY